MKTCCKQHWKWIRSFRSSSFPPRISKDMMMGRVMTMLMFKCGENSISHSPYIRFRLFPLSSWLNALSNERKIRGKCFLYIPFMNSIWFRIAPSPTPRHASLWSQSRILLLCRQEMEWYDCKEKNYILLLGGIWSRHVMMPCHGRRVKGLLGIRMASFLTETVSRGGNENISTVCGWNEVKK